MTRKVDVEEEFNEQMRRRLEELGYVDGGRVYKFPTVREDLDSILDDIESVTGLKFKEGEDGHAQLAGNALRITSKEEVPDPKLEKIEKAC